MGVHVRGGHRRGGPRKGRPIQVGAKEGWGLWLPVGHVFCLSLQLDISPEVS